MLKQDILNNINFDIYDDETIINNIKEYIETLNDIELKALNIAIHHLKSSFNIYKSNGYNEWLKNKS